MLQATAAALLATMGGLPLPCARHEGCVHPFSSLAATAGSVIAVRLIVAHRSSARGPDGLGHSRPFRWGACSRRSDHSTHLISLRSVPNSHKRRMGSPQAAAEAGQDAPPVLYVNGKRHVLPQGAGHVSLLNYLRGGRAAAACRRQLPLPHAPCGRLPPPAAAAACHTPLVAVPQFQH